MQFNILTACSNVLIVITELQMAMLGVARRRNLLNDDVLIALAEKSWDILDISGSEVSDFGLVKVAELCHHLRAIDIRFNYNNFQFFNLYLESFYMGLVPASVGEPCTKWNQNCKTGLDECLDQSYWH